MISVSMTLKYRHNNPYIQIIIVYIDEKMDQTVQCAGTNTQGISTLPTIDRKKGYTRFEVKLMSINLLYQTWYF